MAGINSKVRPFYPPRFVKSTPPPRAFRWFIFMADFRPCCGCKTDALASRVACPGTPSLGRVSLGRSQVFPLGVRRGKCLRNKRVC